MVTKIQRWGNSQGLRLPKRLLGALRLAVGDEVEVEVRDGVIVIRPQRIRRRAHRLEDLVARIPQDDHPNEVQWGHPAGREAW